MLSGSAIISIAVTLPPVIVKANTTRVLRPMDERDWLAERFEDNRPHLRVENLGGWLTTIVARVSLNMLRSRISRREEPMDVPMSEGIKTVIYPASDLARAKAMFSAVLGVAPVMDEPYYVGFKVNGQDIGLDPMATRAAPSATTTSATSRAPCRRSSRPAPKWTRTSRTWAAAG